MKGSRRPKSEYGLQFQEKQDVKSSYGLRERQFRRYFTAASTPEVVIQLLESRLDNIIYRAGFTTTRKAARQLVNHGHFQVGGKNVNIPSYRVSIGDEITTHPASQPIFPFKDLTITLKKHEPPSWLVVDADKLTIKVKSEPIADESFISSSIKPIIEFYSR